MPRRAKMPNFDFLPMDQATADKVRTVKSAHPAKTAHHIAKELNLDPRAVTQVLGNRAFLGAGAKITPEEIAALRDYQEKNRWASVADAAREFCLPYHTVYNVLTGATYSGDRRAGRPKKQRADVMVLSSVDPGKKGAIAFLDEEGKVIEMQDMPIRQENGKKLVDHRALFVMMKRHDVRFMAIEKVGSMPTDGHQGAFDFGQSVGRIVSAMELAHPVAPLFAYSPLAWKPYFRLTADKEGALDMARTLWPDHAALFTRHDRAEAALIGLFALQTLKKQGYIAQHAQEPDPGSDPFA